MISDTFRLRDFLRQIVFDERIGSMHTSLHVALCMMWLRNGCANPFPIPRREIMELSKIRSKATYHKCIRELSQWGHISYAPSFHPRKGSAVSLLKNETILKISESISIRPNFENMPANVVTPEDLKTFKEELIQDLLKLIAHNSNHAPTKKWLKSNEVRRMLLISPGTLQNLRINGTLPFTKIGGVIFYEYQDIEKMIEKHRHNKGLVNK